MHVDAQTLQDGTLIQGDICIIGAGAAGISMAMEWMNTGKRVILLEGGGFEYHADIQDLYKGKNVGRKYHKYDTTRLHYFGGTTNHWGGLCSPFDPVDFAKRSWVEHSGWPISREDLDPFYEKAHQWIELGPYNYDPSSWEEEDPIYSALPFDSSRVTTKMWRLGPTRFGLKYRESIVASENVSLYTFANVCNIKTNEAVNSVEEVEIRCLNGKQHRVKARHFVLACGAVQNARLLLASNQQNPNGLGNDNDLVGRYFMDHPEIAAAFLVLPKGRPLDLYTLLHNFSTIKAYGELALSAEVQEERQILNSTARIRNAITDIDSFNPGEGNFDMWNSGEESIAWAEGMLGFVFSGQGYFDTTKISIYDMFTRLEQAPNPNSRVFLSEEKDALGVPKIVIDWRLAEIDKRSIRGFYEALGEEAGRSEIGRVRLMDWLEEDDNSWPDHLNTGWHHMGTVRMHDDPKQGVVDAHCKVHGISNLYVAGSAAFPTAGAANPTLTVVALTLRLSDHLKEKMG